jgi:hypothetical protein
MGELMNAVAAGGLAGQVILWIIAARLAIVVLSAALELRNEWKARPPGR